MNKKLVFCGAWDLEPLVSWPWQSALSTEHFYKLTGYRIRPFTMLDKNGLHAQYFFAHEYYRLEIKFKLMSDKQREKYVKKICDDYNIYTKRADRILKFLSEINLKKFSTQKLLDKMDEMYHALSLVTMQIWFVLFLDLWFPMISDQAAFKKIGVKARDHSGHQHEPARPLKRKIWGEIARRLDVPPRDILYLFPEEIKRVVKGDKKPLKKIIPRKKLFVTANLGKGYKIYEGQQAKKLVKKFLPKDRKKKLSTLKGFTAYPGKVSGRVRKVLHHKDFKLFKKGEILVALQTLVDFFPVMKKSKAILTEHGGITSHAAVVSREFKKPCIVGVKNLIASLKNRDKVEVDATHSIIKKI